MKELKFGEHGIEIYKNSSWADFWYVNFARRKPQKTSYLPYIATFKGTGHFFEHLSVGSVPDTDNY